MADQSVEDWTEMEERGVPWLFRALLYLSKVGVLNWWSARGVMYVIMTTYFAVDRELRDASLKYLRKLAEHRAPDDLPPSPGLRHCYWHVLEFGRCIFDRFAMWLGERDRYHITPHGEELFESVVEQDRGALLLSVHAGNFYLMRYMAMDRDIKVNIVAYWENSPMVNELLEYADPQSQMNVLSVDPSEPQSILDVKDRIDRGELVAILADRKSAGTSSREVRVPFLGDETSLPAGPYIVAHVLECPVLLTYALRTGPRAYDLYAEIFAHRISLPRSERDEELQTYARQLSLRMEEICCSAPYQWFNFYDFWDEPSENRDDDHSDSDRGVSG